MLKKVKIWHILVLISAVLMINNFSKYILMLNAGNLFTDYSSADILFSLILLPSSLLFIIVKRNSRLLCRPVSILSFSIILLFYITLFSPAVAPLNPDFQNDLRNTRLLPPFSARQILVVSSGDMTDLNKSVITGDYVFCDVYAADEIKLTNSEAQLFSDKTGIRKVDLDKKVFEKQSMLYLLGTDSYGRDIYSRLIYGSRISIFIGSSVTIISALLGIILGFISGNGRGFTAKSVNRFSETLMAVPLLFFIILVAALWGNSLFTVIIILGCTGWMSLFKIVRGEVISLKGKDFIVSAKMLGTSNFKILKDEMMPHIYSPVAVNFVLLFANVIIAESALSFLGFGSGGEYPSWGAMINQGQLYLSRAWWISLFPCLFIFATVLTANSIAKNIKQLLQTRYADD